MSTLHQGLNVRMCQAHLVRTGIWIRSKLWRYRRCRGNNDSSISRNFIFCPVRDLWLGRAWCKDDINAALHALHRQNIQHHETPDRQTLLHCHLPQIQHLQAPTDRADYTTPLRRLSPFQQASYPQFVFRLRTQITTAFLRVVGKLQGKPCRTGS